MQSRQVTVIQLWLVLVARNEIAHKTGLQVEILILSQLRWLKAAGVAVAHREQLEPLQVMAAATEAQEISVAAARGATRATAA
jgi:hypothetical protein